MKIKTTKLILIFLTALLDILLIAGQILIATTNFKWSPWYAPENCMGIFIITFQPKAIVIVLTILCINFLIEETRLNAKMILISIVNHIILIFSFGLLYVSYFLFTIALIGIIAIYLVLVKKVLCNTIRGFAKIIKET